jgi:hypothetical protein
VKSSKFGRVYNRHDSVYACSRFGGKPHRLGAKFDCSSSTACGGVNAVRLSGPWVGVSTFLDDGTTTVCRVEVRRLRTGHVLHSFVEGGISDDGQGNTTATAGPVVLKPNGSAAWIAYVTHSPQPPGEGPSTREVHRLDSRGHAQLDSGRYIRSLARKGSVITWMNAGVAKSAPLD